MSRALLATSVLLALLDADHLDHRHARAWFEAEGVSAGWASCAITQNGFVRIISQPRYPNTASVSAATARLAEAAASDLHEF